MLGWCLAVAKVGSGMEVGVSLIYILLQKQLHCTFLMGYGAMRSGSRILRLLSSIFISIYKVLVSPGPSPVLYCDITAWPRAPLSSQSLVTLCLFD